MGMLNRPNEKELSAFYSFSKTREYAAIKEYFERNQTDFRKANESSDSDSPKLRIGAGMLADLMQKIEGAEAELERLKSFASKT